MVVVRQNSAPDNKYIDKEAIIESIKPLVSRVRTESTVGTLHYNGNFYLWTAIFLCYMYKISLLGGGDFLGRKVRGIPLRCARFIGEQKILQRK